MKKLLAPLLLLLTLDALYSQSESSAFNATGRGGTATSFVTDYQCLGINPGNLGFDTKFDVALGFGEAGFAIYSDALAKSEVHDIVFGHSDSLSQAQKKMLAEDFVGNGITINTDVMPLGFSFRAGKLGTFAFAWRATANYYSRFSSNATGLIFEGYDFSNYFDTIIATPDDTFGVSSHPLDLAELTDGTRLQMNVNTSFTGGFGRKILTTDLFDLYAGFDVKYILGYAYFDFHSDNGSISGASALGLNILDPLNDSITSSDIVTTPYQPVGHGWGYDIGASMKLNPNLTLSAAITDIGKMHYTANVLEFNNVVLDTVHFSGVSSTNPVELISQITNNEHLVAYSGTKELDVSLPAALRFGGSIKIKEFLDAGVDAVIPLNDVAGSYAYPLLGLGAQLTLAKVIKLSSGVVIGGGYGTNIPAGFGLDFHVWEIGIATRDIVTLFNESGPTVSIAEGFLRFKI